MDCAGIVAVIKSMELVIVGRNHDNLSPIRLGLAFWNEYRELGTIGGFSRFYGQCHNIGGATTDRM